MARIPLNTLPAFRAVAERQTVRAAAEHLNLTHSAISQQIRVLEEQLGFDVFERRGRRLLLNASGEAFLRKVQAALALLDEGVQAAFAAAGQTDTQLRVSVVPSFAQRWLMPRIHRWRERHPDLKLELDPTRQVIDLHRDGFHAALRQGAGPWPGVIAEALFEQPMPFLVVGCAIESRHLVGLPPEALLREPLLGDRGIWRLWFAAAGVQADPVPVAVFNDTGLMLQAAEQGMGLALVREPLAADALRAGKLIRVSPVTLDHDVADNFHLVYPPALKDWPALDALRQWLRDEIAQSRADLAGSAAPAGLHAKFPPLPSTQK